MFFKHPPGPDNLIAHRLCIYIGAFTVLFQAQEPVPPDLDQSVGGHGQANHHGPFEIKQLRRRLRPGDQWHIGSPDAAMGQIDRGWRL